MKKVIYTIVIFSLGVMITSMIYTKGENNNIGSTGVIYENNTTVKSALDNLYSKVADLTSYGNATSSTILSGYTALVNGEKITGSYTCPTCDYSNYVAKSNITSKSGTENVTSLGGSSTTLNGYYNLSNYKVSCPSGYSSCSSCCSSAGYYSSCSSCCSTSNMASTGVMNLTKNVEQTFDCGFTPNYIVAFIYYSTRTVPTYAYIYNRNKSTTNYDWFKSSTDQPFGTKSIGTLPYMSISGTGFTFKWDSNTVGYYICYGGNVPVRN